MHLDPRRIQLSLQLVYTFRLWKLALCSFWRVTSDNRFSTCFGFVRLCSQKRATWWEILQSMTDIASSENPQYRMSAVHCPSDTMERGATWFLELQFCDVEHLMWVTGGSCIALEGNFFLSHNAPFVHWNCLAAFWKSSCSWMAFVQRFIHKE